MNAKGILSRLHGVRRGGGGWIAKCPAHDDRNPSLSVNEVGEKVLLHCFAGCHFREITAALGVAERDFFQDNGVGAKQPVAAYDYTDETGKLLYQVVRYEPKDFRQRRPDGNGNWAWSTRGVRRVLYRLPDVLRERSVLVCEGEKDCGTARRLGLTATTNAGGAESKWLPEYSESLRGKRVCILCDDDEPGHKHGHEVATSLLGVAESVRLIETLPDAKDLSEWVELGGTKDKLLGIIKATSEYKQSAPQDAAPKPNGFKLTKLGDLMSETEERVAYVWEPRLSVGGLSVLASKPKAGKTTLSRNLALAVARGEDFLGYRTTQGPVILLSLEEKRSEVRAHFRAMGATGEEPILIHCEHAPEAALLALSQIVHTHKPALIIIDPLQKLMRVKDGNDYAQVTLALEPFLILARGSGAHLMVVHHLGKGERADATDSILGSTALFAGVDTAIILKRSERYRTIQTVQRYGEDLPETVLEFDPEARTLALGESKSRAEEERISEAMAGYLAGVKKPQTEPEILNEIEGRQALKKAALRTLFAAGKVTRQGTGKKGDPFTYAITEEMLNAGTQYIQGTRIQESEDVGQTPENTGEMLVPEETRNQMLVPDEIEIIAEGF